MSGGKVHRDDRQISFLYYFLDPKSESYSNAYKSAQRAGFRESYCKNITQQMPEWIANAVGKRALMLEKAERRLEESLDWVDDKKILQDTAKFLAKTLGKQHYSERVENTGADGKDLRPVVVVYGESDPLADYLKNGDGKQR